jgi:hypothetical protein
MNIKIKWIAFYGNCCLAGLWGFMTLYSLRPGHMNLILVWIVLLALAFLNVLIIKADLTSLSPEEQLRDEVRMAELRMQLAEFNKAVLKQ